MPKPIKVTLKAKTHKDKVIRQKITAIGYMECPHCKKTIFAGEPELIGQLKKWKKERNT